MKDNSDVDVLIVGAGPTGLMLALELASHENPPSFRIIDCVTERSDKSRATTLQSRSMELLARHGLAEEFTSKGRRNMGVQIFANRTFAFELDISDRQLKDTAFPSQLMISQADTESIIEHALKSRHGISVEYNIRAERIEQARSGSTVSLRKGDGEAEKIVAKYVLGCDGAHSIVRREAGLSFEGGVYAQDFILADVHLIGLQIDMSTIFMSSYGFMSIFPLKDSVYRLICSRASSTSMDDSEPVLEDFEKLMIELVPAKARITDPIWITRFRLHHRIVENYQVGKLLLAGDAAHIHSPAGGQGMNTGMQDAVNLGWKLALVLNGTKPDSFLESYNTERHKIGETLLKGTDKFFEMMTTSNRFILFLRNWLVLWVLPWLVSTRLGRSRLRYVTQLGIRYRHSDIVGDAKNWTGSLRGGDRAPDGKLESSGGELSLHNLIKGMRYHLVLFSGIDNVMVNEKELELIAEDFSKHGNESFSVHKIICTSKPSGRLNKYADSNGVLHRTYGLKDPSFVWIRPDGHVEFIGPLTAIAELKTWVKSSAA